MVKFSYYGHAAFLLDDGTHKVLVDPFLTGNPVASVKADDVECDYILVSHAHGDHLGDAPSIAARTGAKIVSTPEVISVCESQTLAEIASCPMNIGGSLNLPFGKVRMTFAQHSAGVAGGIACGFVVYIGGRRKDSIDYAVRPIGDNYTMGLEDAAMAAQWVNAGHVIPVHYNTWPVIKQEARHYKDVTEAMTRARVHIMAPGDTMEL